MADIPNAVVKRLLVKHGGGLRVSGSAIEKAAEAVESFLADLAREAQASAESNKRKTIMDSDVEAGASKLANPAGGDFRPNPDSPALDAGVGSGATRDFHGTPRPQGNAFDIGAYEGSGDVAQPTDPPLPPEQVAVD